LPLSKGGALGWRAAKRCQSAEAFRQVLTDREIFFGAERPAAVVVEGQKYLYQVQYKFPLLEGQHSNAVPPQALDGHHSHS
jgi:hypothetical protein